MSGKSTTGQEIEAFILSSLHEPTEFKVSESQIAKMSCLSSATRKFNKAVDEVHAKIAAASKACTDLSNEHGQGFEMDSAIIVTQAKTTSMVEEAKEEIFREAEDLTEEQKHLVYGKAGLALSLRLKEFTEATNKLLSWDISNASDPRNVYRKCNHCGTVFNKTEGCDGETICGSVPSDTTTRSAPGLDASFGAAAQGGWMANYYWNGESISLRNAMHNIHAWYRSNRIRNDIALNHVKREGAVFESGCGARISWCNMLPLEPEEMKELVDVEVLREGDKEEEAANSFSARLEERTPTNLAIMQEVVEANKKLKA